VSGEAGTGAASGEAEDGEEALDLWGTDAPPAVPGPKKSEGGASGRGRPPGSLNKKTRALQKLYAGRGFKDPLMWGGELLTMPPLQLWQYLRAQHIAETGKAKGAPRLMEVVQLQRLIAADLAPYLHGKMPIRIDHGDERLPVLIIQAGSDQVTLRKGREAVSAGGPIIDAIGEGEMAETGQFEAVEAGMSHGANVSRDDET
jgi:hypothetical protein